MVTPALMTDAVPLLNEDKTGRNSALDIRRGLLAPLLQVGSTGDEFVARQGVLVRGVTFPSMKVSQNTSANRFIKIGGGSCVVTRTGEGPYLLHMTDTTTLLQTDTADVTNPVVEAVVARILDKNITADVAAPRHGPYYDVIRGMPNASLNLAGTPGTAGAPPILPDGSCLLAYISRLGGGPGDVITDAMITDKRKSTALLGATRLLLGGDLASDPGILLGEKRQRIIGGVLQPEEFWGIDSKWHGTASRFYQATQASGSGTQSLGSGNLRLFGTIAIPDLGYDYTATFRTHLQASSLGSDNYIEGWVRSDDQTSGTIWAYGSAIARGALDAPLSLPGYKVCTVAAGSAKNFYFTVKANTTGSFSWTDLANGFSAHVVPL